MFSSANFELHAYYPIFLTFSISPPIPLFIMRGTLLVLPYTYTPSITIYMNHMNSQKACACPHHKLGDVAIIVIGLLFLGQALNILDTSLVTLLWPIFAIAYGAVRLIGGGCACYARS